MTGGERPREIENPTTGEVVRFVRTAEETGGELLALVRIEMQPALRWEEFVRQLFALAGEQFDGETGERSFTELFTEIAPEIELVAPEA